MQFNSIDFAIFLPVVFLLYWFVCGRSATHRNLLIVAASYFFYGWWDPRFLGLIVFSTLVDYFVGRGLAVQLDERKRKWLLWTSMAVNLGLLGWFKYFDFFLGSFVDAFSLFGVTIDGRALGIVLPVGISFYTFQTMSYTIDVYRRHLAPTRDLVAFAAFVSFFPQLVAGPIERASNLLPQFQTKRVFSAEKASDGMLQILWGLVKKVVIADNCAEYANHIFNNAEELPGSTLLLGALFFTFQIYGDFSGYSDIAIGTARLFGMDLMKNFAFPYFSRDIAEFWRRWHISLSTWFRDYLYIPLGGSRGGRWMKVRNTLIIFLVSGLWHGANWTFVIWGLLNAIYFLPLLLGNRNRTHLGTVAEGRTLPNLKEILSMFTTFMLTVLAWVFFRAATVREALEHINGIFSSSITTMPVLPNMGKMWLTILLVLGFVLVEWTGREQAYGVAHWRKRSSAPLRWSGYLGLVCVVYFFGNSKESIEFIYFQF